MIAGNSKIYRCAIDVRGYELDSFGHVNHAVYVSYLEHARWVLLQDEGITLEHFNRWKRWPVIANLEVRYLKPAYMGERLEVESRIVERGRSNFTVEQMILRGGAPVLKGVVRVVTVNENGRPAEMPEEVSRLCP